MSEGRDGAGGKQAPDAQTADLPAEFPRLPEPPRLPVPQHVAVITGLSGAGKTATSKLFEDLGYTVVDNLPAEFLPGLAELVVREPARFDHVAIVIDVRAGDPAAAFAGMMDSLEARGLRPQVFFLEARDEVLVRRFSETRHRHPLGGQRGIAASIAQERQVLEPLRDCADAIIDTSDLSARELRERIFGALDVGTEPEQMTLQLVSFGYKYGLPIEADIVFDVRFMENPYYDPDLRPLSGLTEPVRTRVLSQPAAQRFLDITDQFFEFAIPAYTAEGKTRLTVAIGCTGGYHRSIAIAEELKRRWIERGYGSVSVWHRELERA
ncbi:MAG: RNase adapter RapZ [Chloroflexi bacterium]|nr:RNase adapter RapZ [Chloroflexota bacterium]